MQVPDRIEAPLSRLTAMLQQGLKRAEAEETGADMAEYAFLLALIALASVATIRSIGPLVQVFYDTAAQIF